MPISISSAPTSHCSPPFNFHSSLPPKQGWWCDLRCPRAQYHICSYSKDWEKFHITQKTGTYLERFSQLVLLYKCHRVSLHQPRWQSQLATKVIYGDQHPWLSDLSIIMWHIIMWLDLQSLHSQWYYNLLVWVVVEEIPTKSLHKTKQHALRNRKRLSYHICGISWALMLQNWASNKGESSMS